MTTITDAQRYEQTIEYKNKLRYEVLKEIVKKKAISPETSIDYKSLASLKNKRDTQLFLMGESTMIGRGFLVFDRHTGKINATQSGVDYYRSNFYKRDWKKILGIVAGIIAVLAGIIWLIGRFVLIAYSLGMITISIPWFT